MPDGMGGRNIGRDEEGECAISGVFVLYDYGTIVNAGSVDAVSHSGLRRFLSPFAGVPGVRFVSGGFRI